MPEGTTKAIITTDLIRQLATFFKTRKATIIAISDKNVINELVHNRCTKIILIYEMKNLVERPMILKTFIPLKVPPV
jgi:hypothetical protein